MEQPRAAQCELSNKPARAAGLHASTLNRNNEIMTKPKKHNRMPFATFTGWAMLPSGRPHSEYVQLARQLPKDRIFIRLALWSFCRRDR